MRLFLSLVTAGGSLKGKWSSMLKITSFLGLQQTVLWLCVSYDSRFLMWPSCVTCVPPPPPRCGSRSWATTWRWRRLQRPMTGRRTLTSRCWGLNHEVLPDPSSSILDLMMFLCFRMTCPSRSSAGEPRPSRALDVKSTSGKAGWWWWVLCCNRKRKWEQSCSCQTATVS